MKKDSKMINNIDDIKKEKLVFVNRQNGSGTRLLTDYLIKKANIDKNDIIGYKTEVLTHTAVASAVISGNADIGIGIESVARQMGLLYKPLEKEEYDFLIPKKIINSQKVKDFISIIEHADFRKKLIEAGGYEIGPIELVSIGE